jgi:hypothetical protein
MAYYQYKQAYDSMLILEKNIKKILNIINKWKKTYLKDAKDKKKVEQSFNNMIELVQSGDDNIDIMDKITEEIIKIGKQYDASEDEDALDDLGDILGLI